jgi:hypothetical protein
MSEKIRITLVFGGKPLSKDNRRFPVKTPAGTPVIAIPKRYKDWERARRQEAALQVRGDDRFPIPRPTRIRCDLIFAYPYEPSQNDVFNAPKSICDAMGPEKLPRRLRTKLKRTGPIYEDDSQIWVGSVLKVKTTGEPVIVCVLETMTNDEYRAEVARRVEASGYALSY